MFTDRRGRNSLRTSAGLSLLATMAIGVGACGAGSTTRPGTAAAAVTSSTAETPPVGSQPAAATTPTQPATTQGHPVAPATTKAPAAAARPTTPKPTSAPAPVVKAPAPTTPALPARRQPTVAEINQIIGSVHALVPFTPTPAQIAQAGNQVCTALDQGKTVAEVKATALQMAGAYAALVPASVADSAVRTIVTTFCPGYTSKLV